MFKHTVRAFICVVLLFFSLSYSIASLAAESNTLPVTLVTTADYQIGAEGLPDNRQRSKSSQRSVSASSNIQTKRHLVSLYGGESGERIPERGYLTDVVWGEQSTYPAASADAESITHERIVYYSFNVGPWKRKLNSETSVLTRAFMTQPLLVFLSDSDKAAIAAQLLKTPLFAQALALHQQQVNDPSAASSLLDDYVEALGEQGVAQLTTAQKQSSGQVFQSRMKQQRAKMSATATTVQTGISFDNPGAPFNVFQGMSINGEGTARDPKLDFKSNSSLYYGIQELAKFDDTKGGFGDNLTRHFFDVHLIEPVKGVLNSDTLKSGKSTPYGLSVISPVLTDITSPTTTANIAIFRNNPNTYVDAPMVMNMVTLVSVTMKAAIGISDLFQHDTVTKVLEKVKAINDKAKPYKNAIALSYSVAKSIQDLVCTATESKDVLCNDYASKIDRVVSLIPDLIGPVETTLKAGDGGREAFDSGTFCSGAVAEQFSTYVGKTVRKNTLGDSSLWHKIKVCMVNEIFTKPLLNQINAKDKALYSSLQTAGYDRNSITVTANYFARHYQWRTKGLDIAPKFYLETLVSKLLTKQPDLSNLFSVSSEIMNMSTKALKFWQAGGKVDLWPFVGQMSEAFVDYINNDYLGDVGDKGKEYLTEAFYDAFKTLTPAKFVQLASVANDAGALAWDWVTDPSVIKLTMTRDAPNTLAISTMIPDMKGVRYLKVPSADVKLLDYSGGLNNAGNLAADDLLAVSNAPDTNHLLVYEGFKASVENQGAFLTADKGTIQKLLADKKVNLMWHVKKFNNSAEIAGIPLSQRKKSTSFKNETTKQYNYLNFPVWEDSWANWVWGLSPIIDLDPNNPLNKSIFKDENGISTLAEYQAMDFTKIYKNHIKAINLNPLKGDTYPLQHKTAGIYSDYTHIHIKSGADEKLYQNTFNIYVLPNLNAVGKNKIPLDDALNEASRLYCEDASCAKNSEIQLNFYTDTWDQIGQNGLWAVWMSAADGLMLSEPVAVREQAGNSTSTLRLPNNVSRNDYLVVYEDVMNGYLKHAGKSTSEVLRKAFNQRINYGRYPVIALQLSKLQTTTIPLLKPVDTDNDGVPDTLDAFPNDPNYAYDTDQDTLPDEWENQYGLDISSNDAALDLDNDGINNLDEFKGGTDPAYQPFTLSGTFNNKQVILKWNAVKDAAYSLCRATERIEDIDNCLNYAGGAFIKVTGSGTQYTVNGLTNGKTYYFRVIAENNAQTLAISNLLSAIPNKPYTVNDTGITSCSDGSNNNLPCPVEGYPNQDAQSGRDVSQNDNSNGHSGFNFSKISSTGAALAANAASWNCVKDNVTGLIWEVKTDDNGLQDKDWTYTWYQPDNSKNGGSAGYQNQGSCGSTSACDTDAYVKAVNAAGWCGYKDWRMPTVDELADIASLDRFNPSIDTGYFPNTQSNWYWSSSPVAGNSNDAWIVNFYNGSDDWDVKGNGNYYVRLVRSGQ